MILSVIPVALLALVWWSLPPSPKEQVRPPVETEATARYVVQQSDFPVWVPEPDEGWIPTVSWYEVRAGGVPTWHISFETPAGEYLALTQAADVDDEWLTETLREGSEVGEDVIDGPQGEQTFTRYEGPRPSNAELAWLVGPDQTDGSTVVVHGTVGAEPELPEFLDSVQVRD